MVLVHVAFSIYKFEIEKVLFSRYRPFIEVSRGAIDQLDLVNFGLFDPIHGEIIIRNVASSILAAYAWVEPLSLTSACVLV